MKKKTVAPKSPPLALSLTRMSAFQWRLDLPPGASMPMRAEAVVFGGPEIADRLDPQTLTQLYNVACMPGLAGRVCAMPDAHSGYGFPIGGVAAFRPKDGVISAGGVGFDMACGVRTHLTDLAAEDITPRLAELAEALYAAVPSGVGSSAGPSGPQSLHDALAEGAAYAVRAGHGSEEDLLRIEERGTLRDADPAQVSAEALKRGRGQLGTLGSGNHYLEVQEVEEVLDEKLADGFGLRRGRVVVSIHCGSRGLGHQVATDFVARMNAQAPEHGLVLADRNLACAPIGSELGQAYFGAMQAAANFAMANRQIIGQRVRNVVQGLFRRVGAMPLLWDVSHNTCKVEEHMVDGRSMRLWVHRKGATRAFPPGHPSLPPELAPHGQPIPVGGSMGTASYVLAGIPGALALSWGSACHGAGRLMSRGQARAGFKGKDVVSSLRSRGIVVRSGSLSGVAEEAPGAYKDIEAVIRATTGAGLAAAVARLRPLCCVKG
ncbi:protein of unknown function UPF0027 [Desulfovibrio sp. X2]|uniref:RtcB family protein n=1 Tax=Desulfovibrio sp. X2 TaxID=941449 RepID=UPI000358B578|nr:RtcB family protein [Desulfovibrio sp. X2]EPR44096.1 protein of unknown function UPF0027 [Desulfovibrio sp. X2]